MLEKLNKNSILNHWKPPDSTNNPTNDQFEDCANNFKERTTRDSTSIPTSDALTKRSVFGRHPGIDKPKEEVNNSSNELATDPANSEHANDLNERISRDSIETLTSYSPGKRSSKKDLDQEHSGLKEEFNEIYCGPQATLKQLNTIHSKWLLHQYKRVHRLSALEGDNQKSPHRSCMKRQFEINAHDYQNWLNTHAAYSTQ